MQLGEWVEFEQIVGKTKTSSGSQPTTQALGQMRRGIIVGMRQVYDVQFGTPPTLTNPQVVLLVAVSLHRRYRVFPADARPTTPPQPKRRRTTQQAAKVTPATTGGGSMSRNTLSQTDLDLLVANEINRRVAAGDIYTAYDVTSALRAANLGTHIPHDAVRRAVHDQMEPIVASRLYDRESAQFGRSTATRYLPA